MIREDPRSAARGCLFALVIGSLGWVGIALTAWIVWPK